MKNIGELLFLVTLLCLFSCQDGKQEDIEKVNIDFFSDSQDFNQLNILDGNALIALSEGIDEEYLLKQIDKVVVKNCTIYIADTYMKNLFLYNMEGHLLGGVGKKGEGPDEYLSLSDFCVDDDGKIYWYDGIKDKVQVYGKDLSLLEQYKIPFKAECIQYVDSIFLFSLAPYNIDRMTQKKCLVYTNAQFNPVKTILEYSDDVDANIEFYSPFISLQNGILYNRVINNNVYVLNNEGIKKCYYFDFGTYNVRNESLRDLNKLMESKEEYCYLALPPILFQDFFIGCLNRSGDIYTFVYDIKTSKSYVKKMSDFTLGNVNLPISLSDDNRLISYINKEIYPEFENDTILSDEVRRTISKDGFVICLSKFK